MFIYLMEELQEQILGHCSLEDLKSFSLTNSEHHLTLKKYLNQTMNIPEHDLHCPTFPHKLSTCHVKTLRLNSTTCIPRDVYKAISTNDHLNALDLRGVKQVTDSDIIVFSQRPSKMKFLYLRDSAITHEGVSFLSTLTRLLLERCFNVDDRAMQNICRISQLSTLYIGYCNISDDGLSDISNMIQLRDLRLHVLYISDVGFERICQLSHLKILHVKGCHLITDSGGFCNIANLTELEELHIYKCDISDDGFDRICTLPKLTKLDVSGCVGIQGFNGVSQLTHLQSLVLAQTNVGDHGAEQICTLRKLRKLDLSGCKKITDIGFNEVSKLTELQTLVVAGTRVGDTVAGQVTQLRKIERLDISDCGTISDAGLSMLKKVYGPCMVV